MANSDVTPAMRELLRWIVERGWTELSGGTLIDYYRARWQAESGMDVYTTPRAHGWRRAGGLVLRRMADRGLLEETQLVWGTPYYRLTEAGRAAASENAPAPAGRRRGRRRTVGTVADDA